MSTPLPHLTSQSPPVDLHQCGFRRTYKIPEGKGENSFAFDGKWLDRDTALKVIESTHVQWKEAVAKRTGTQEKKAPWLPALDWKQPGAEFLQASDLKVGQTIKLA